MTFGGLRVAVVVPAFNEEALIGRTLSAIPSFVDEVVVVDDGSADRTAQAASAVADARVAILKHGANRGVGAAIATGYRYAFERGADVAAVMAGDAQMDPQDLPALLEPIARGTADYVKGDRLSHPSVRSEMPLWRFVGNHVLSSLTRLALGAWNLRDSQCGYTALSRVASRAIDLGSVYPRYGYPNDLVARVSSARLRIEQRIVRPVYGSERSGITLRTALVRIPLLLVRILLRRLRSSVYCRFLPDRRRECA